MSSIFPLSLNLGYNFIVHEGNINGNTYIYGKPAYKTDMVAFYLTSDCKKYHLNPISSTNYANAICLNCSKSVIPLFSI